MEHEPSAHPLRIDLTRRHRHARGSTCTPTVFSSSRSRSSRSAQPGLPTQTASAAELLYAVDSQNRLISFSSATPSSIARIAFTGLPAGEEILGLDQRPANKTLVAVGRSSRLYNVNPTTGAATAIGAAAFTPALSGASFGFDFNPTVDRIRLTSDARQDLRLHPDTGATAATDGTLTYAPGDPGASATPRVVASAYTNSTAGATTTQLFDLDAGRDVLALQNPPNNGTLTTIGPLGVDASDLAGFDISGVDGIAYAALQVGGASSSSLYTINLASGAATVVGRIGGGSIVRALAGGRHRSDRLDRTVSPAADRLRGDAGGSAAPVGSSCRGGLLRRLHRVGAPDPQRPNRWLGCGENDRSGGQRVAPRRLHEREQEIADQSQVAHDHGRCHRPRRGR